MPPKSKSSTSSVRRLKSSDSASSLKQGTLPFLSKRTASGTDDKGKLSRTPSRVPSPPLKKKLEEREESIEDAATASSSSESESEGDEPERIVVVPRPSPAKRIRSNLAKSTSFAPVEDLETPQVVNREALDVEDKAGKWNKHYGDVRRKMGNLKPIHAKGQSKVHHILRVFDLSDEYGPCIGVTRLDRWERAAALGLNPPPEVREILTTKQGFEEDEFKQSVFYGEV
ncbi:hypothetical protein JAAARDRAFT_54829 [Jaapia argillacea MUCL 33604]|uniref:DNA polymerase delta subunit 4 n=1 Tax=Jaapia argillacea MUCL 33604 TaxID=933084 RepID=A0A067Q346_9AGAM|nr:hypothetical protein JAAARDRAFT_54829 [Jaapia argillacea MUCL 33604]